LVRYYYYELLYLVLPLDAYAVIAVSSGVVTSILLITSAIIGACNKRRKDELEKV